MARTPDTVLIPGFGQAEIVPVDRTRLDSMDAITPPPVPPNEEAARTPGDVLGTLMALRAADPALTIPKTAQLVVDWAGAQGVVPVRNPNGAHRRLAASGEYGELYGISPTEVEALDIEFQTAAAKAGVVVRESDAASLQTPRGLLVVRGFDHTVNQHIDAGSPLLRIDQAIGHNHLTHVTAQALRQGIHLSPSRVRDVADHQSRVTLGIISPGAPIFEVNLLAGQGAQRRGTIQQVTHPLAS